MQASVCFVICSDQEMAQDAVQSAWPIAWRKLGSLRDPDRLRPWVVSVAANGVRQLMRHPRPRFRPRETSIRRGQPAEAAPG